MDAVELPPPAAVAVSKLLTAEGFSRAGVAVEEVKAQSREADSVSILGRPSINGCSSACSRKVAASEQKSVSRHGKTEIELCRRENQFRSFQGENIPKQCRDVNNSLFLLPKNVGKQSNRKAGKNQRNSSPCSKRPRADQVDDSMSLDGADDGSVISEKLGSGLAKCTFTEKSRLVKQKHSHDGKRIKPKTKYDSFLSKAGFMSSISASGGNNILGIYGLKSDIHNITNHVDELSLNELLDGSYKCPSLFQDKGKKASNTNENILHSVRKVCSILQLQRPVQTQSSVELDSSSNRKTPAWLLSSGACVTTSLDCDKGDTYMTDLASSSKIQDSCSKPRAPSNMINSPLHQPKVILERLSLPPTKDLDSLLLDTAKPTVSSRSTPDLRSGKLMSKRAGLPPFSWSQFVGGPCKTNIDTGKLSINKSTCQGRWVRIGSTGSSLGDAPGCFSDLDSLTYDHGLLPSIGIKLDLSEDENVSSTPVRLPWCELSLTAACPPAAHVLGKTILKGSEAGWNLKNPTNDAILNVPSSNNFPFQENEQSYFEKEQSNGKSHGDYAASCCYSPVKYAVGGCDQLLWHLRMQEHSKQAGYSPTLLAAAQTLYEIASHSRKQNENNGKIRWPKKPSQKAMKARKSRSSSGKAEIPSVTAKSVIGSSDLIKDADQIKPSKKSKFYTTDKEKDLSYTNNVGRGVIKWSTQASNRSSPIKLERDLIDDTKLSNADTVKLLSVMPSSTRLLDKACNSHQKPRNPPLTADWGRGRVKKE